jgi:23S rRNA (cytosine1962-C5)-methyltransferase
MQLEHRDLVTHGWEDYELLDSGEDARLERFGEVVLLRPAQQAIWKRRLPRAAWESAHATFTRSASGQGTWRERRPLPEDWTLRHGALRFFLEVTSFGHIGVFPEQRPCWEIVQQQVRAAALPLSILNLFAYSGSMTLAAAEAGARVCHLDASPPVVDWARHNASASGLSSAPVRWIVDDALKFVRREARRAARYEAVILDPPSFGRGPKGEVFKLEEHLQPLLAECLGVLADAARFVLLSCHTPGITGTGLANLLAELQAARGGRLAGGELLIAGSGGSALLPSGSYALWTAA